MFFGVVRKLVVPFLSGTSIFNRFSMEIFPLEWKIAFYNSRTVPKLAIKDLPEEHKYKKDRLQDLMTSKREHATRLVCVPRQTKIPPRSERMLLVETDAKELIQIEPILAGSTQPLMTASAIVYTFPSRSCNVIIVNPTNAQLSFAKHQRISKAFLTHTSHHTY